MSTDKPQENEVGSIGASDQPAPPETLSELAGDILGNLFGHIFSSYVNKDNQP